MLKTAIVSLNILALFVLKFILGGEVNVEQKVPEQIGAGETFTVEVIIEKGDHEGFAKWQQKLPEGFIASVNDVKGATFSFKKQEVKLIWMALPNEETITIKYDVKTDPTLKGSFSLEGKFSYLEENERKDISAEAKSIKVGGTNSEQLVSEEVSEPLVDSEENEAESTEEESEAEITAEKDVPTEEMNETVAENNNESQKAEVEKEESAELVMEEDDIKIYRTVSHIEKANYRVSLKIEKGNLNSFGKIEEYIPEDFTVTAENNAKGIFSFNNQVLKILWMAIPQNSTIELSYLMESTSDLLDKPMIHGVFSYLKDDESVQKEIKPSTFENYFKSESDEIVENSEEKEMEQPESIETMDANDALTNEQMTQEDESNRESNTLEDVNQIQDEKEMVQSITDIPSPETSISYKVQIAAGKKEVKQAYFRKNHNITEQVNIEYHNNWYKYTLGKYDIYKAARDRRNEIWAQDNKINDAFVTAYNAGERISVQEALMISKQKWYK